MPQAESNGALSKPALSGRVEGSFRIKLMPPDHVFQLFGRLPVFSPDALLVSVAQKPEPPANHDDILAGGREFLVDRNHL